MARKDQVNVDRLPPHDPDAEMAVLGCILLDAKTCVPECLLKLRGGPEMFYDLRHQEIYRAMISLFEAMKPVDSVTLLGRLRNDQMLEQVGGLAFIQGLPDVVTSASNLEEYLDAVQKKHLLRCIIRTCTDTVSTAYETNGEAREFLDKFETDALSIRRSTESFGGFVDIKAMQQELTVDYENAYTRQSAIGLHTGFKDLDRVGGGMMEQEMIVVAGLRSTGKTSLAATIAFNVARAGTGVGLVSLETSGKKMVHRMACAAGQFDGSLLMRGVSTEADAPKVKVGFARLAACRDRLFIHDKGPLSPNQVGAICRRMYQAGARLFVIDYLQLLLAPGQKEYDRTTFSSKAVKNIAKELNCPVIVLSGLSRDSDKEKRRPRLSDLRASGQIEYDADKAWLLSTKESKEENLPMRQVILDVAKNKDGPTGELTLMFFASQFRMESCAAVDDADVPAQQEFQDAPERPMTNDP